MRIVAVGDNCVDIYTNLGLTFPGGGGVNFAVQAAREGASAAYLGAVGPDFNGRLIQSAMAAEGVDISGMQVLDGPTAVAQIRLVDGDRTFLGSDPGIRYQFVMTDELRALTRQATLVHTTLDARMEAEVPGWHAAGALVSFDFSHRPKPEQLDLLPYVHLAFFSGQKIGPEGAEEAARTYHARGARVVVITLGEHGSLAFDGERICRHPAEPIQPLDTLGAGDAYMGGFAVEYLRSRSIPAAMAAGTRTGTAACGYHGGFGYGTPTEP